MKLQLIRPLALAIFLTSSAFPVQAKSHLGVAIPDAAAERVIDLSRGQRVVNIEQGESVRFVANGQSFSWKFDTLGTRSFSFLLIAPEIFPTRNVEIYVGENSLHRN